MPDTTTPAPTLLEQMGGTSGLIYAALPSLAFVAGDAVLELTGAIAVALATAVVIAVVRLVRREPIQPALSGALGVAIGAYIAWQTGEAKDYFLLGIWMSLAMAVVFLASVLMRWPLVGVLWNVINGAGQSWRHDKPSRRAYDVATLAFAAVFTARFVVQRWLYDGDQTGWLAVARIAMGYPLLALALLVAYWAVRRSKRRLTMLAELAEEQEVLHRR
ncbi:DUF3159 domain-containing protein [Mycobacterium sp. 236(2023)]|uniref:DUF3159 domain-containing protein n=1 Tax=Mycobacterium sp. 236(2023) TaxID=3038163 RepID=UPI0024152CAD|nr:DUF3159 domain-containing protein [Mycobacterium sp. 236(2023)]MDG4668697.1 DUF3159 domain-containing protein [Mycobacterium sp. 236(2023)]